MRRALLVLVAFAAFRSAAQTLVCPTTTGTAGKPCDVFHFHVQLYEPDTKGFTTLSGVNAFASLPACERARDARMRQNASIVDYVKRVKTQPYEADRFGPCHCDLTFNSAASVFLTDQQRTAQRRSAEELRRRVRHKLLDLDLEADSELLSSLSSVSSVNPMLAGPRLAQVPAPKAAAVENPTTDLRLPRAKETRDPVSASIDLPLADVPIRGGAAPSAAVASAPPPAETTPPPAVTSDPRTEVASGAIPARPPDAAVPVPSASPAQPEVELPVKPKIETPAPAGPVPPEAAPQAATAPQVAAKPAPAGEEPILSAADSADIFILVETQRVRNVLDAISDSPDETGEKLMEACRLRVQALTGLKALILGSGARSMVASAARHATDDDARLDFVRRLFGEVVAAHWIPRVTTDVLIPPDATVEENPQRVLRDSSGTYTDAQKRRALYTILTQDSIAEDQQSWLIPAIEHFLQ